MTKDQYLGFQQGPRPEQSDQRQPDQAASFSHQAEALRDSASVASRIRFPTGTVLIRRMSVENPLWGAPRIHGELLKLGFEVAQSSVARYMVKRRGPPSQGWRTFLRNHAPDIAAMDLFVFRHRPARPQRARLDQRHNQPDSGMDCASDHPGLPLG